MKFPKNIKSCDNCGVLFDIYQTLQESDEMYDTFFVICPVCKTKYYIQREDLNNE